VRRLFTILAFVLVLGCGASIACCAGGYKPGKSAGEPPKVISPRERAKEEFAATVRTWGHWATWLLLIVGVAALVMSFLPAGNALGISTPEAVLTLGISATVPVAQYLLSAWGVIAAEVGALVSLIALVVATAVAFVGWIRRRRKSRRPTR